MGLDGIQAVVILGQVFTDLFLMPSSLSHMFWGLPLRVSAPMLDSKGGSDPHPPAPLRAQGHKNTAAAPGDGSGAAQAGSDSLMLRDGFQASVVQRGVSPAATW